jgi:glycosyltransferase involved in cell wall biosynthesis
MQKINEASKQMKIAVIFDELPQAGGAFNQSVNAILQFKRVCEGSFDIQLFHLRAGFDASLKEIGLESFSLRESMGSMIVEWLIRFSRNSMRKKLNLISPRERQLLSNGIDLAYFVSPNKLALSLQVLRYFATQFDISHRDFPEFPESSDFVRFEARDAYNWRALVKAVLVLVDSEELKLRLIRIYGLQEDRILTMPFTASKAVASAKSGAVVMEKYKLKSGYVFYPAQFWSHKNHVRILQALRLLKQKGCMVNVVFVGGDKGGQAHVEKIIVELGLVDQVHLLGFVPLEDMDGLYTEASALIMPTYFGPTNIPPLEAWSRGVPVIYSSHLLGGLEDGALGIDPDVPETIANAIEKVMQDSVRQELIAGGRRCLARVEDAIARAEEALRGHLTRFARRRETWAKY